MFETILFSSIPLSRLADLSDDIIDTIAENHDDNILLNPFLDDLENATDELRDYLDAQKQSYIIRAVTDTDQDRNDAYSSLRDHVKAGIKRINDQYSSSAIYLYQIFVDNGNNLEDLSYEEKTETLENLLEELTTAISLSHLRTVNAQEWLDELEDTQATFKQVFAERENFEEKKQTISKSESLGKIKKSISRTLNAMEIVGSQEDEPKADTTISSLRILIKEANLASKL